MVNHTDPKAHRMSEHGGIGRVDGINHENRALLERLHREMAGAFDVQHASTALGLELDRTRKLLAYLARRGWLARVRRGLYVAVPLDTRVPGEWAEDGWIVAEQAFSPCYIGGWSACEHWELTEQVFRTVLVITAKKIRHREPSYAGHAVPPHRALRRQVLRLESCVEGSGTCQRFRSDAHDRRLLDDPTLGGGIRNVADVLYEYLTSEHRDDALLIDYGDRLGNRAIFKRLGSSLENSVSTAPELTTASAERRSAGLVALDPSVQHERTNCSAVGLRANVALGSSRRRLVITRADIVERVSEWGLPRKSWRRTTCSVGSFGVSAPIPCSASSGSSRAAHASRSATSRPTASPRISTSPSYPAVRFRPESVEPLLLGALGASQTHQASTSRLHRGFAYDQRVRPSRVASTTRGPRRTPQPARVKIDLSPTRWWSVHPCRQKIAHPVPDVAW